jgi:hypothetical protein
MEHTRTTPQQSVILKKIGYDVPDTCYYKDGILKDACMANYNSFENAMSAPKLTYAATWLRKEHGWHVAVIAGHKFRSWSWAIADDDGHAYTYGYEDDHTPYKTHDLALSAGIDFILTKLNEDDTHPTN